MTKTIAIIGASGRIGGNIARSLATQPYRLLLMGRNESNLKKLCDELSTINPKIDVAISACPVESSWEADIVILALPYLVESEVAAAIREVSSQKIVVSLSNPINDACNGQLTLAGTSAAEQLQELLPQAKVIKAFNTLSIEDFEKAKDGFIISSYIAGNDDGAVTEIMNLVKNAGFHALSAGNLAQSQMLEEMQIRQTILADIGNRNSLVV